MKSLLNYISGYRFIKAFLTKPQKQPQTGSLFPVPLPTEQLFRKVLLVYLPVLALALSLYLLWPTNADTYGGNTWRYQYVVDSTAIELIDRYDTDPEYLENALDLASDYEWRMKFQAEMHDYVVNYFLSLINLPAWGPKLNNEDTVPDFAATLAKYAPKLRGFRCYPDGSRGGQPLTSVPYSEAVEKLGEEFNEHVETHDICGINGTGGTCGV